MESLFNNQEIFTLMIIGIVVMLILALTFVLFFGQARKRILQQQMQAQQAELAHQQSLLFNANQELKYIYDKK